MNVLVVDDDRDLVAILTYTLQRQGFGVVPAYDVPTALERLRDQRLDAALLDVDLGAGAADGFALLGRLRQESAIPVLMLTGRDAEADTVRGLDLGADDYLPKPFSHRELLARLRAQIRRHGLPEAPPRPVAAAMLRAGPLAVDAREHTATKDGRPLRLTATEFRVLEYLMAHEGAVVSTRTLMKQVWGFDDPSGKDAVRVTIHRLRRKLDDNAVAALSLLRTVPGVGVLLKAGPAPGAPATRLAAA